MFYIAATPEENSFYSLKGKGIILNKTVYLVIVDKDRRHLNILKANSINMEFKQSTTIMS